MRKNGPPPGVSTESDEAQSFYGRWSQRKKQVRAGQLPVQDPVTEETGRESPENLPQTQLPPQGEAPEKPLLTDADMPPLESLDAESDYSGFLSEGVSEELRNKALRKLFLSPQFNIVDGLDDYCEDFTSFEPLGDIITADMRYEREYEAQRALEREQEQEQQQALVQEPEPALEQQQEMAQEPEPALEQHQEMAQESESALEQRQEMAQKQAPAQEPGPEQAQTAVLESDPNIIGEGRAEQRPDPLDSEVSAAPAIPTEAQDGSDPNKGDVEDRPIRAEAGAESDESLPSVPGKGNDNQSGTAT